MRIVKFGDDGYERQLSGRPGGRLGWRPGWRPLPPEDGDADGVHFSGERGIVRRRYKDGPCGSGASLGEPRELQSGRTFENRRGFRDNHIAGEQQHCEGGEYRRGHPKGEIGGFPGGGVVEAKRSGSFSKHDSFVFNLPRGVSRAYKGYSTIGGANLQEYERDTIMLPRSEVSGTPSSSILPGCIPNRAWHSVEQIRKQDKQSIRFGSFSLGDVFEHEIRNRGSLAFRVKHSDKLAAARFVSTFTESMRQEMDKQNQISLNRGKQRSSSGETNRGRNGGHGSDALVSST